MEKTSESVSDYLLSSSIKNFLLYLEFFHNNLTSSYINSNFLQTLFPIFSYKKGDYFALMSSGNISPVISSTMIIILNINDKSGANLLKIAWTPIPDLEFSSGVTFFSGNKFSQFGKMRELKNFFIQTRVWW